MAKEHFRGLGHDGTSKGVALVGSQVMTVPPPSTDHFFKVGASIDVFVIR